ncbi:MAG: hypothetical protein K2W96_25140, partial [Gemmataceae bacterium]|nr:hypothetical protein [Gemmataceae bacterium]
RRRLTAGQPEAEAHALMKAVTFLTLAGCLAAGMALGLLAGLKLHLARKGGSLGKLMLLNLAVLPVMAGCGFLADLFGVQPVLIGGASLLCLALLGVSAGGRSAKTGLAVLVAGLGTCALLVGTLLMVPRGLLGQQETAASLNFGLVFIALGALLVPVLLGTLTAAVGYRPAVVFFALAALAPALLAAFVPPEEFPQPGRPDAIALAGEPSLWLAGLVFALYAPLEAFVSVWVTSYLKHHDAAEAAPRWLASFWVSLTMSRVLFGLLQHATALGSAAYPSTQVALLVVPAALAAIVLGNLAGTAHFRNASGGLVMLGFFLGPVLPMLLAIVFGMEATAHAPATALGAFFGCGAVGSLALAGLVGWSAQEKHIRGALRLPLFIALALAFASLFFGLIARWKP